MKSLPVEQLYSSCDPAQFDFESTADIADLENILGQERALESLQFGIGIRQEGYNLFVLGPAGIGKHTMISQFLEQRAADEPVPADWVYVANFEQPEKPRAIELPCGRGSRFCQDMKQLVEDLRSAIPSAFETEQYHVRLQELHENFQERSRKAFTELAEEAEQHDIGIIRGKDEITFVPQKKGTPLSAEQYDKLSDEEKKQLNEVITVLEEKLRLIFHQRPQWQRELREAVNDLNREVGLFAVGHLIDDLKESYADIEEVHEYLDEVQEDVIHNLKAFRDGEQDVPIWERGQEEASFRRYQVNLLVDNGKCSGAPIVYEDTPLFQNLVGRVEYLSQMGTLVTDYMMIKPGVLHKANGGYLIIDVHKLLLQPYAWEGLKRVLFSKEIAIQSLGEVYSLISTVSLEPEPIPVDLKVVLVGERLLYYLLQAYDTDFSELFKVSADFENTIERTPDNYQLYARLLATLVRKDQLLDFDRQAIARVIEHSMRLVDDKEKFSAHMQSVNDLLREADHWARERQAKLVTREDVQLAIHKQVYRADRIHQNIVEEIKRGTLLIDTEGEVIAQVNGLFIQELGKFAFGHPGRITATTRIGEGEVIDIEREVELGGAIHSKGVLILSSYLAARYAQNKPLSLAASLVFEQSYGGVEGDSATVGEVCALLSALAEVPVRQWLAVTGSANQRGQVQAIGGVNEKIEGFYDVCKAKGFNGQQGVIIPASNIAQLMLREDVLESARKGEFHIYEVETIDEAISLLTGLPAGDADEQGEYPEGSINYRVKQRLEHFADLRHDFAKQTDEHEHE